VNKTLANRLAELEAERQRQLVRHQPIELMSDAELWRIVGLDPDTATDADLIAIIEGSNESSNR
jgi:hypothetical protein